MNRKLQIALVLLACILCWALIHCRLQLMKARLHADPPQPTVPLVIPFPVVIPFQIPVEGIWLPLPKEADLVGQDLALLPMIPTRNRR